MKSLLVILIINLFSGVCFSATEQEAGVQIMQEAQHRSSGFGDSSAEARMILTTKEGDEAERLLKIKTLEVQDDGNKLLIMFETPLDVKGTSFLSYTHPLTPDEQWLYLPDVKRVKRVSSSNKSGAFVGSELAYEDLGSFEIQKYDYKYLREDVIQQKACYLVELYPRYEGSGYTKLISWIEKDRYIPLNIQYFDRKKNLLKTQEYRNYKKYLGRYWIADEIFINNHQNGNSTKILYQNTNLRTNLTARQFDQNAIQHNK